MNQGAVLELTLTQRSEARYFLSYQFTLPDGVTRTNLRTGEGLDVQFDLSKLRVISSDPIAYGQALAEQLFPNETARSAFRDARSISESAGKPFRISLAIKPSQSDLHGLRWETLVDPNDHRPVCTNANTLFFRYISPETARSYARPDLDEMRAVVLVANPANLKEDYNLSPVVVPDELDRARAGLGEMVSVVLDSQGKATLEELASAIQSGCNLVYLVAHGSFSKGSPVLYLENPDGSVFACPAERFIGRLSELNRFPLLIVLVSCQSAGTGDGVAETAQVALAPRLAAAGVPAVAAMQGSVSMQTMAIFMPEFLTRLMEDGQIDRAVASARAIAHGRNRPDWWMPVLFSSIYDNTLFNPPVPWVIDNKLEPETVLIRAGKFLMGSGTEGPWLCHEVDLPAYRIGKYPVTNRQYAEFVRQTGQIVNPEMGWDGQVPSAGHLDDPVSGVTWYQAMAYCKWLESKTGRRYTLPNEAQWEKAARGVEGRIYPWGDEWQEGRANNRGDLITPAGHFPAQTPYGCFDMAGNVREWTLSLWGEQRSGPDPNYCYPWKDDSRNDPLANEQIRRIFRGGASDNLLEMSCFARDSYSPTKTGPYGKRHGFRVAVNL